MLGDVGDANDDSPDGARRELNHQPTAEKRSANRLEEMAAEA